MEKIKIGEKDPEAPTKRCYNFFLDYYKSGNTFTKEKLIEHIKEPNIKTYFSKKISPLLETDPNNSEMFYVSERFKRFSEWRKFRQYYSQKEHIKPNYQRSYYENVLIYEFFLPLNNESFLRSVLDQLFFKDSVLKRVKRILITELDLVIPQKTDETDLDYYERIVNWISERFGGYSIALVNGRFKTSDIKTYLEVGELLSHGGRYLIDETTAIVKFIFQIGKPKSEITSIETFLQKQEEKESEILIELKRISFLFKELFVNSILEVVSGEDEIWMLESGYRRSKLFIFKNIS